jgi:hypothetical protein
VPTTIAGLKGIFAGSQIEGWISATIGRIEALAAADGSAPQNQASIYGPPPTVSTFVRGELGPYVKAEDSSGDPGSTGPDPGAPAAPPFLFSLGEFFLTHIDSIYDNYIEHFDITSGSMSYRPDGIAPSGLASASDSAATVQEAQDMAWVGAGLMSYRPDGIAPYGLAWGSDSTAVTVQEAQDIGWVGAGLMSYVMAGGKGPALSQRLASQGGGEQSPDSSPEEPVAPASITAGEIPLDILLSDPELSTQDVSISLQQIAELIPDDDSSLALVATLWTVPMDSRAELAALDDPSCERAEPAPSSASPPPWAFFVIGLDEAIEQSRDACGTTLSGGGRPREGDGAEDAAGERLEWRSPIIPTAEERRRPDRAEESSPGVGPVAIDRAAPSPVADSNRSLPSRSSGDKELVARPSHEDGSPHDAIGGQTLTEGFVPSVWAASASALIAGWLCARRQRWKLRGSVARIITAVGGTIPKKKAPDRSCACPGSPAG